MTTFRRYELSKFNGPRAEYKTISQRRALIGRLVGYDMRGSCMSHFGVVTSAERGEIYIDGSPINLSIIEQLCVLDEPA